MPFRRQVPDHRFGRQLPLVNAESPYSRTENALAPGWGTVWLTLVRRWALWLVLLEILLMLSSTVRRSLLSLLAVSTVGTLGFSAAASIGTVTSDTVGAGDGDVEACTEADVVAAYTTVFAMDGGPAAAPGYEVATVTLTAPDTCAEMDVDIALLDEADSVDPLWESVAATASEEFGVDPTPGTPGDTVTATFTGIADAPAELLTDIAVVIAGASS